MTYIADGQVVETCEYKITDGEYTDPVVPAKKGYTAKWSDYVFNNQENITVKAEYTAVSYTAEYFADGQKVVTVTYTMDDEEIIEPNVPAKQFYNGTWSQHSFDCENIIVNAVYTPIVYKITYVAEGKTIAVVEYTIEDFNFDIPEVPDKNGYDGKWEDVTYAFSDITVNAIYTERAEEPDSSVSSDNSTESTDENPGCISSVFGTEYLFTAMLVSTVMVLKRRRSKENYL